MAWGFLVWKHSQSFICSWLKTDAFDKQTSLATCSTHYHIPRQRKNKPPQLYCSYARSLSPLCKLCLFRINKMVLLTAVWCSNSSVLLRELRVRVRLAYCTTWFKGSLQETWPWLLLSLVLKMVVIFAMNVHLSLPKHTVMCIPIVLLR